MAGGSHSDRSSRVTGSALQAHRATWGALLPVVQSSSTSLHSLFRWHLRELARDGVVVLLVLARVASFLQLLFRHVGHQPLSPFLVLCRGAGVHVRTEINGRLDLAKGRRGNRRRPQDESRKCEEDCYPESTTELHARNDLTFSFQLLVSILEACLTMMLLAIPASSIHSPGCSGRPHCAVPNSCDDCVPAESLTEILAVLRPAGSLVSGLNCVVTVHDAPGARVVWPRSCPPPAGPQVDKNRTTAKSATLVPLRVPRVMPVSGTVPVFVSTNI